jgi:formylglycine-generating enzyme required for sulfatase activity
MTDAIDDGGVMRGGTFLVFLAALFAAGIHAAVAASLNSASPAPGIKFRECRDCPEMIVIPPGSFLMGSPTREEGRDPDEGPQHQVTLPYAFAVAIHDVTKDEYATFVRETKHPSGAGCLGFDSSATWVNRPAANWRNPGFPQTGRDPVVCVSWDDAQAYVRWLNTKIHAGRHESDSRNLYRLLTEAEFEYAARAGTNTPRYWNGVADNAQANIGRDPCCGGSTVGADKWEYTSPVGSFPPNGFGLHDMAGDVWQWTGECYHDDYNGAPTDGTAWTSGECKMRVLRGGSWMSYGHWLRSAKRIKKDPANVREYLTGFRVARSLR